MKLGEAMYAEQVAPEGTPPEAEPARGASDDGVVDAEFEEVDENKKNK